MPRHRLIVLKFGGSVLRDESTLRLAVHEIYRWRRQGWQVAAVVSAFAGRTDELLRRATCGAQQLIRPPGKRRDDRRHLPAFSAPAVDLVDRQAQR